jgi:general transcription factor 3C polypeptide 3 (transcription factor C subunit 4)
VVKEKNVILLISSLQEALYNVARAYHHVGLVTLAASYYEKVLAMKEKDEPVPRLPYEKPLPDQQDLKSNYCDLRREAAYNLHLIYKKSGAVDLARQILKNQCTV